MPYAYFSPPLALITMIFFENNEFKVRRRKIIRVRVHSRLGKSKLQGGRKISIDNNSYGNSAFKKQVFPSGRNVEAKPISEHTGVLYSLE